MPRAQVRQKLGSLTPRRRRPQSADLHWKLLGFHLKHALGLSYRKISEATGAGKTQAAEYVRRALAAGITWPVPEGIDDAELERRLFPVADDGASKRAGIDWPAMQRELKRRGVTLALLWQEYLAEHANGYSYTRFCELYGECRKHLSATMRQTHVAGDKLFVDWAGDTIGVVDPATGEVGDARIFVAALGASNFTYAEARSTETLPDWIGAHVNAFAAIGRATRRRSKSPCRSSSASCWRSLGTARSSR